MTETDYKRLYFELLKEYDQLLNGGYVSPVQIRYLREIAEQPHSCYELMKMRKEAGDPVGYKNVNTRLAQLERRGLVERFKYTDNNIHNAVYFRITEKAKPLVGKVEKRKTKIQ